MPAIRLDQVTKIFDDGTVAVDRLSLMIERGEFLVLLGPSGCGKSTALRMIAGLEKITSGELRIGHQIVNDLLPRDRDVAMVFQDFALYPHLKVYENIAFPLRMSRADDEAIEQRVPEVAEALGIVNYLDRFPTYLSGGERQRVAMARALVRRPAAFLLDEPLSNLDAGLRAELRAEIATLTREMGVTTVYVTHDQTEAMTMADRVAVLRSGRLHQVAEPHTVYDDPATLFVAGFLGQPRMNLLRARVRVVLDDHVSLVLGQQQLVLPWYEGAARFLAQYHDAQVTVGLRADAVLLGVQPRRGDGRLSGRVKHVEYHGHETLAYVDTGSDRATIEELETGRTGELRRVTPPRTKGESVGQRLTRMFRRTGDDNSGAHALAPDRMLVTPPFGTPAPIKGLNAARPAATDMVVRTPGSYGLRPGQLVEMVVDMRRLYVFDDFGHRIRLSYI
jgi:multiple sugar transport system ATP-binding protein